MKRDTSAAKPSGKKENRPGVMHLANEQSIQLSQNVLLWPEML
jgi:hypothetical protein